MRDFYIESLKLNSEWPLGIAIEIRTAAIFITLLR